jgi:hypothetical protein
MPTRKYYKRHRNFRGGMNKTQKNNVTSKVGENSLFETLGTSAKTAINKTATFLEDKGARLLGYKRINPLEEQQQPQMQPQLQPQLQQQVSELASTASNIASGIANKANQVGAIIVEELNKNIEGPIKNTVSSALERTVAAAKDVLAEANEKLNNPEFVQEVSEITKNASEAAATIIDAAEPAINEAIDKTSEIGTKVASKVGESAVSIALNTVQAIPGPGIVVGLVRDVDKLATAGEAILEAGAETVTTFADSLKKAEEAVKNKMAETEAIKNRISSGVDKFNAADNISKNMGVGNVTKNIIRSSAFKKGGKPSRKFRKAQRRLSRRFRFKTPVSSSM